MFLQVYTTPSLHVFSANASMIFSVDAISLNKLVVQYPPSLSHAAPLNGNHFIINWYYNTPPPLHTLFFRTEISLL